MLADELVQTTVGDGLRGSNGNYESSLLSELQLMLQEQRSGSNWGERERDLNRYRSGSAPPTVEGSLTAVGSLFGKSNFSEFNSSSGGGGKGSATNGVFSEDDIRSHPAYLSYYYSHENVNPRLPPPLLSKEDWRVAQRFQAGRGPLALVGGIGDRRRKNVVDDGGDSSSLFSMQPRLPLQRRERENEFPDPSMATPSSLMRQTSANCPAAGLGARRKSFADILQEGLNPSSSSSKTMNGTCFSESHLEDLCNGRESAEAFHSRATATGQFRVQGHGATNSISFASAAGSSLSRSTTPEAQIVGGSSSTGLPPVGGRVCSVEKKNMVDINTQNGFPPSAPKVDDLEATLSGLSLPPSAPRVDDLEATLSGLSLSAGNNLLAEDSHIQSQLQRRFDTQTNLLFSMPNVHDQSLQQHQFINKSRVEKLGMSTDFSDLAKKNGMATEQNNSKTSLDGRPNFSRRAFSSDNLYPEMKSSGFVGFDGSNFLRNKNIPDMDGSGRVHGGYFFNNKLSSAVRCHFDTVLSGGGDGRGSNRSKGHIGVDLHSSVMDGTQHSQPRSDYEPRATANVGNLSPARNYFCTSQSDLVGLQNAYYGILLAQQKHEYELLQLSRSGGMNHRYYPNISYNRNKPFHQHVLPNSSDAPGGLINERSSHFTSTGRNSVEGPVGSWNPDFISNVDRRIASSLLEEFKSNKIKSLELSDIVDHLVEFSRDQFGSRFIQQKLETATVEEKNKIFPEIVPHCRTLMTDVFGNYVIQKFFEHGTDSERMDLASQLTGHVLPLSLQMYGCRVIQKALEVVDVDQQTLMVLELDGSVMQCVCDQNGNHVIQKSIECVPHNRIQFIISAFYGQVVALSTHPYGCRVIQRVLEHCSDLNTQQIIMDEIMQSVCTLAQDQYGNYVIQHILQHGKADERTAIISKLAGQIVKMSQQKFASNVVEKCLTFGGPEERQLLVTEMLGYSDDNEPLQAMMKDPFGNYVVQKVLETYNDQSRELILSRIKVHLNTLKKYTYGKHIVSRVEKLITAGERRMAMSSSFSS